MGRKQLGVYCMSDNRFDSSIVLAKQLADAVSLCLKERVEQKGRACLAVSGGNTPKAFFEELGKRQLPWSHTTGCSGIRHGVGWPYRVLVSALGGA